jgi:hypothetical protein
MDANREESYVGRKMGRGGRERWMKEREGGREVEKSETHHVQVYTLYKTFAMVIT